MAERRLAHSLRLLVVPDSREGHPPQEHSLGLPRPRSGGVDFQNLEPRPQRTLGRSLECGDDTFDARLVQRHRRRVYVMEGQRTGAYHRPTPPHDHQRGPAYGSTADVDQMPVFGQALLSGVLAHRRHDNPVPNRDAADRQWTQQVDLRNFPIVITIRFAAILRTMRRDHAVL
jgi:hypothetical protein